MFELPSWLGFVLAIASLTMLVLVPIILIMKD
jgi:hypothetical protein